VKRLLYGGLLFEGLEVGNKKYEKGTPQGRVPVLGVPVKGEEKLGGGCGIGERITKEGV